MQDLVRKQIKKGTPGLAVAIFRDGKTEILLEGLSIKQEKIKVKENTLFEIGSISKVFTGIMLADQIQKEKLSLETPIQDLLPSDINAPLFKGQTANPIKLKHLITHSSGLPRLPGNMGVGLFSSDPYAKYSRDKLYTFLNSHRLKQAPGKPSGYSNLGTGLLGQLLADHAAMSYEKLLQASITEPLELTDTLIELTDDQLQRHSQGYGMLGIKKDRWNFTDAVVGAGGIRSSISDMAKFLEAMILKEDTGSHKTIYSSIEMAQKPLAEFDQYYQIGMGWLISESGVYWHNGGTGGYRSFMGFDPNKQIGTVILSNSTKEVDTLGMQILGELLE